MASSVNKAMHALVLIDFKVRPSAPAVGRVKIAPMIVDFSTDDFAAKLVL